MKDILIFTFVLTSSMKGHTSDEQVALRNAARASYKQSGLEDNVNRIVKKEIPRDLQMLAGNLFLIGKTIQEKRLVVTWSF